MADLNEGVTPLPDNPTGYLPPSYQPPAGATPAQAPQQDATPPWERYANATVGPAPSAQQGASSDTTPPWERYGSARVIPNQQEYTDGVANAAAAHLTEQAQTPKVTFTPSTDSSSWGGQALRFLRGMWNIGDVNVADAISARYLKNMPAALGGLPQDQSSQLTTRELYDAIHQGYANDKGGETAGALGNLTSILAGGGAIAKGIVEGTAAVKGAVGAYDASQAAAAAPGTAAAVTSAMRAPAGLTDLAAPYLSAAAKGGLVQGALNFAAASPKLAQIAAVAATGGAVGAVQEGIKASVSNLVNGGIVGGDYTSDNVNSAVINGALLGALVAPAAGAALQAVGGGAKYVGNILQGWFGGDATQNAVALRNFVGKLAEGYGGDANAAIGALQQGVQSAMAANGGRVPAMAEIIGQFKAQDLGKIAQAYSGLSEFGANIVDAQIPKVLAGIRSAVENGTPIQDVGPLRQQAVAAFKSVIDNNGSNMVAIPDETIAALRDAPQFLNHMAATGNLPAQAIKKVLDSQDLVASAQGKLGNLTADMEGAQAKTALSELSRDIAALRAGAPMNAPDMTGAAENAANALSDQAAQAGGAQAQAAILTRLKTLQGAIDQYTARMETEGRVGAKLGDFTSLVNAAKATLADYSANGLKVSLRDANELRMAASAKANSADPWLSDSARNVNAAVANIGTSEVPAYKDAVQTWRQIMTRIEGADLGPQVVSGKMTPENVGATLQSGYINGVGTRDAGDVAKGMAMGARVDMRSTLRQTSDDAARLVDNLARSEQTQANLRQVLPESADALIANAQQAQQSLAGFKAALSPSPGAEKQAESHLHDFLELATFGTLGGAAKAGLATRWLMRAGIPRAQAQASLTYLLDPSKTQDVLNFVARKGVDPMAFRTFLASVVSSANGKFQ